MMLRSNSSISAVAVDIEFRAVEILRGVDALLGEDHGRHVVDAELRLQRGGRRHGVFLLGDLLIAGFVAGQEHAQLVVAGGVAFAVDHDVVNAVGQLDRHAAIDGTVDSVLAEDRRDLRARLVENAHGGRIERAACGRAHLQ